MPKRRIRIITKKQKIIESSPTPTATLEQTVREPTFLPGRPRRTSFPLALPFGTPEQTQVSLPSSPTERTNNSEPEATSREAFSYDRPGGTNTGNDTTYRIPGASDQTDNQVYRTTSETKIESDRKDRFNPLASDTDRLRDTNELNKGTQDRYQGASQTYQSSSSEKKNAKELERSRF